MMCRYVIVLLLGAVCCCSCSVKGNTAVRADSSALELPLPEVPQTLTGHEERADYIMNHFWDSLDVGDTLKTHDREFMERNLVNFMSLFPHGSLEGVSQGVCLLVSSLADDSAALSILSDIVAHYLDEPNSPMRSETYYILFLESLLQQPTLYESDRLRAEHKLETAKKNRPGMTAADFAYVDRNGKRCTLHSTAVGGQLLLVFYDPECDHCSEILEQVSASAIINGCIESGKLTVLAVYTEGNRELWENTKAAMPQQWMVGCDTDGIVDLERYSIPAMPVMYLLDSDKKVLLKDAFLPDIEACVSAAP